MKEIFKQFRPFDYILIGLALLLSFLPATFSAIYFNQQPSHASQLVAIVRINGEIVEELPLSKDMEKTYYPNEGQYNIVQVKDNSIRVRKDNSPDQIAVNTGWIHEKGQILVCLPHQLVIEIIDKDDGPDKQKNDEDDLILPI